MLDEITKIPNDAPPINSSLSPSKDEGSKLPNETVQIDPVIKTPVLSCLSTPFTKPRKDENSVLNEKILKLEAQVSALKSHLICEISSFTEKLDSLSESVRNT